MSTMEWQHALEENWKQVWISNISSSGVNESEVAWVGRQMLNHIISSEISAPKIPSSCIYIFSKIPFFPNPSILSEVSSAATG